MIEDEVLREIRQNREARALSFNYDIRAMMDDLRARTETSGGRIVRLPPPSERGEVETMTKSPAEAEGR